MIRTAARPFFYFIVGAPGAGKSSQIHVALAELPEPRRVIFDIEGEYSGAGRVVSLPELKQALIDAGPRGAFALVYQPGTDDESRLRWCFDKFCQLAFAAGNMLLVVDELADVDTPTPSLIVPGWSRVLRKGRKRGLRVIAATQRPADCNKKLRTFATRLRVGMLADAVDVRLMASALMVHPDEVAALQPLQWIERDRSRAVTLRGTVQWKGRRPSNVPRELQAQIKSPRPARSQ